LIICFNMFVQVIHSFEMTSSVSEKVKTIRLPMVKLESFLRYFYKFPKLVGLDSKQDPTNLAATG
jgi:hypothetical protein